MNSDIKCKSREDAQVGCKGLPEGASTCGSVSERGHSERSVRKKMLEKAVGRRNGSVTPTPAVRHKSTFSEPFAERLLDANLQGDTSASFINPDESPVKRPQRRKMMKSNSEGRGLEKFTHVRPKVDTGLRVRSQRSTSAQQEQAVALERKRYTMSSVFANSPVSNKKRVSQVAGMFVKGLEEIKEQGALAKRTFERMRSSVLLLEQIYVSSQNQKMLTAIRSITRNLRSDLANAKNLISLQTSIQAFLSLIDSTQQSKAAELQAEEDLKYSIQHISNGLFTELRKRSVFTSIVTELLVCLVTLFKEVTGNEDFQANFSEGIRKFLQKPGSIVQNIKRFAELVKGQRISLSTILKVESRLRKMNVHMIQRQEGYQGLLILYHFLEQATKYYHAIQQDSPKKSPRQSPSSTPKRNNKKRIKKMQVKSQDLEQDTMSFIPLMQQTFGNDDEISQQIKKQAEGTPKFTHSRVQSFSGPPIKIQQFSILNLQTVECEEDEKDGFSDQYIQHQFAKFLKSKIESECNIQQRRLSPRSLQRALYSIAEENQQNWLREFLQKFNPNLHPGLLPLLHSTFTTHLPSLLQSNTQAPAPTLTRLRSQQMADTHIQIIKQKEKLKAILDKFKH